MAAITHICANIHTAARQTPARVRILCTPSGALIGGGFEQFDHAREHHRLPTVTGFWLMVMAGIGQPSRHGYLSPRRELTAREVSLLWRATSGAIRHTRKLHPELRV